MSLASNHFYISGGRNNVGIATSSSTANAAGVNIAPGSRGGGFHRGRGGRGGRGRGGRHGGYLQRPGSEASRGSSPAPSVTRPSNPPPMPQNSPLPRQVPTAIPSSSPPPLPPILSNQVPIAMPSRVQPSNSQTPAQRGRDQRGRGARGRGRGRRGNLNQSLRNGQLDHTGDGAGAAGQPQCGRSNSEDTFPQVRPSIPASNFIEAPPTSRPVSANDRARRRGSLVEVDVKSSPSPLSGPSNGGASRRSSLVGSGIPAPDYDLYSDSDEYPLPRAVPPNDRPSRPGSIVRGYQAQIADNEEQIARLERRTQQLQYQRALQSHANNGVWSGNVKADPTAATAPVFNPRAGLTDDRTLRTRITTSHAPAAHSQRGRPTTVGL